MANIAALATVYNHYMANYVNKASSPYDAHKKSELRFVYNSILKQNKFAPLAIHDKSLSAQKFAVGVKEEALSLGKTIASVSGLDFDTLANTRLASSSNPDIATATYVGGIIDKDENPSFEIEVLDLASPQINTGKYLNKNQLNLKENTYSFDVSIQNLNYEFQYNINKGDTNKDIQETLARLIKRANIGLEAFVDEDASENTALIIQSKATGNTANNSSLFSISDNKTSKEKGSVEYLGLNQTTSEAKGATLKLNGDLQLTNSNTFTVEKSFQISLQGIGLAEGEKATINLKKNSDAILDHINSIATGYNKFLNNTESYIDSHPKAKRILTNMNNISNSYKNELDSLGLSFEEDGTISIRESVLKEQTQATDLNKTFDSLKSFTQAVLGKINEISLNPMEYTNKTIVAYKNPATTFTSPYTPSAYSGMMFNSYC